MAKITAEEKMITREKIKSCSREVFREFGFKDTKVKQIAQKVGIGVSTLYGYYPSKVDLFTESFLKNDNEINIPDEEIEEHLKKGLIKGMLELIDKVIYLNRNDDYDLLRTFFIAMFLDLTDKKYDLGDIYFRFTKISFIKRVLDIYEKKHKKLCDFDTYELSKCVMDTFVQITIEDLLFYRPMNESMNKIVDHLKLVFVGKYDI